MTTTDTKVWTEGPPRTEGEFWVHDATDGEVLFATVINWDGSLMMTTYEPGKRIVGRPHITHHMPAQRPRKPEVS